jgi:hypothetical protein
VGVVGALIDAVGIAGVVEEVDVGLQVAQAANFGGVVAMLLAVGVVAAGVGAAVDVVVAGPAVGNLSALVEVAGVGLAAGGAKVIDIAGADNLSGVAGGFAGVVVVEQEVATDTAAVAAAAGVDTFVRMNMSAGVDDVAVALATPWSVTVLMEREVGSVADVADGRYVGAADWDEDDDRRMKRK